MTESYEQNEADLFATLQRLESGVQDLLARQDGKEEMHAAGFDYKTLLSAVLKVAPVGFSVTDRSGRFVEVSPSYCEMFGYQQEELIGQMFTMAVVPEQREAVLRCHDLFLSESATYPLEWEGLHKDGRRLSVITRPTRMEDTRGQCYKITSIMDVTELREHRVQQRKFGQIFENLKEEIFIIDPVHLHILEANRSAIENTGYSLAALRRLEGWRLFSEWDGARFRHLMAKAAVDSGQTTETALLCRADQTCYEVELKLQLLSLENTEVVAVMAQDITAFRQTVHALRESETSLAEAQQVAGLGSWKWDLEKDEITWSDHLFRIMGVVQGTVPRLDLDWIIDQVMAEDRERVRNILESSRDTGAPFTFSYRVLASGQERILTAVGRGIRNENGVLVRLVGSVHDITERRRVETELAKLTMVIEQSTNIVFITDHNGIIEYVNPVFEQVTGYTREEAVGQNPRILASGDTDDVAYAELWKTILAGHTWRGDFKNKTKSGTYYWGKGLISPVRGATGEIQHFLAIQENVTEKKEALEREVYLSNYDLQTGLLNRESFIRMMDQEMGGFGAGLLIDIDGFKLVNDRLGYAKGDRILRQLVRRIQEALEERFAKDMWFVGRFAGDQIGVCLRNCNGAAALDTGETLRKVVEEDRFADEETRLTVSIGIASYPDHAGKTSAFLVVLDAALAKAKTLGKNRCRVFNPEDRDEDVASAAFHQKQRIQSALAMNRFEVWYQPILHLATGKIRHYESLVRMRDSEGRIVLPGAFINAAERYGLIGSIDRAVTGMTIRYQAELAAKGQKTSFSMNLSGKDLGDGGMLDFLRQQIAKTGADPRSLIFEITETAAIQDMDRALDFILALKEIGCRFSLDDFGVGFTSFVYLREMDVDFIKIDGSFIRKLHERRDDRIVVRAITQMAREMGIQTVAEFVETEETLALLHDLGVDYGQGFLIGKPAPPPVACG